MVGVGIRPRDEQRSRELYGNYKVTIVIPCLNEESGIRQVLARMPAFVDETIVVDNGSTDLTAEISHEMGARVIREEIRGYGRAYRTGLLHAAGDIIVTLDGDHSYPVDAVSYLIEALLDSGVGFVSASRFPIQDHKSMSLTSLVGNVFLSTVMSALYLRRIRDSQSGMWIFFRKSLEQMNLKSDGMAFSEEIKIEALTNPSIGLKEIPIRFSNRQGEKKLEPWRDGWNNLCFLFKKRFF